LGEVGDGDGEGTGEGSGAGVAEDEGAIPGIGGEVAGEAAAEDGETGGDGLSGGEVDETGVMVGEAARGVGVVAVDFGEVGIEADIAAAGDLEGGGLREEEVVECLMAAFEDVAIALGGIGDERQEVVEVGVDEVRAGFDDLGGGGGVAGGDADDIDIAVVELEAVHVTDAYEFEVGIGDLAGLDVVGEELGLSAALGADAGAIGAGGFVVDAVEAALVAIDEGEVEGAAVLGDGAVEDEGSAVVEGLEGAGAGVGVGGGEADLLDARDGDGVFDEVAGIDEAGVVGIGEVGGVEVGLAGVGIDLGGDGLEGREVFDLLEADDVGEAEVVADGEGEFIEAVLEGGGGEDGVAAGIIGAVVEALEVVGGDGEFAGFGKGSSAFGDAGAGEDRGGGGIGIELIAAEGEAEDAGEVLEGLAGAGVEGGGAGEDVIELDALGIAIEGGDGAGGAGSAGRRGTGEGRGWRRRRSGG